MKNQGLDMPTLFILGWAGSLDAIITEPWFQYQSQALDLLSLPPAWLWSHHSAEIITVQQC